jgi:hypothetical protein
LIDYFLRFNSEAEAIADPQADKLGRYDNSSSPPIWHWSRDYVIPDVKAWRPSQDVGSTPVHTYIAGWMALVGWSKEAPYLLNHPNLQFALNREWDPNASPRNLVVKNNIGAVINDINVDNVFCGSNYPVGGFN